MCPSLSYGLYYWRAAALLTRSKSYNTKFGVSSALFTTVSRSLASSLIFLSNPSKHAVSTAIGRPLGMALMLRYSVYRMVFRYLAVAVITYDGYSYSA